MKIPIEPIGSIPRPAELKAARASPSANAGLQGLYDKAVGRILEAVEYIPLK